MKKSKIPSQLSSILNDINKAIEAKLYYPALVVTLTLPEICSALPEDNSVFIREKHYAAFVDKYTERKELGLSGIDCYRLRGGIVHRGNAAGHPFFGSTHVIFSIPETRFVFHGLGMSLGDSKASVFDVKTFCSAMIGAVERWYEDFKDNEKVKENMVKLLSMRPDGMPPFIVGSPLIGSGL